MIAYEAPAPLWRHMLLLSWWRWRKRRLSRRLRWLVSLDIYNAASTPYTLQVMTIVALIFVPIVLIYQGWSYWVFRKRVSAKVEDLHY